MSYFQLVSVAHVFLVKDQQILLMRRSNTGHEDGRYGPPGGKLDGGEEVKMAAIREVREECGVVIQPDDLEMTGVMHIKAANERVDFFFITERWVGEIRNAEPNKCDHMCWFPMDDLPDNLIPFIGQALKDHKDGRWFSSYGWN
ncbi:NUDIX domain-containing protein [Paenibacillus sp. NPDC058177]|uniref:NUDIX hydrolase n=1 Tax=Paenibacillus sp. NPDC058177 TaxID=3346369 RepID=UPI0036DA29C3